MEVPSQHQFQSHWMWTCTLRTKETKFLLPSQPINTDPPTLHLRKVAFLTLGNQAWGEAGKFPGFQHRFRVKIQGKKEEARLRQLWNQLSPPWGKWIQQFMLHFSLQRVLETVFIKPRHMCFLNWGIVALQYCVGFCYSRKWISVCVHASPPGPPCPLSTPAGHLRAPSWARCAIWQVLTSSSFTRGSEHTSVPVSRFVPPSPSPPCPHVYSLCLCLHSCPANRFTCTIFSRAHIYALIHTVCFSDLLHSVWQSLGPSTSLQITQFCCF